jgi:N-acetylated-alpha-linked acidic dipeptidase
MDTFGDPGWFHHQQIAQLWGLTALRLATSPIIGFNATAYAEKLKQYVQSLKSMVTEGFGENPEEANKHLNLKVLEDAVRSLAKYAKLLDTKGRELSQNPKQKICYLGVFCVYRSRVTEIAEVNKAYLRFERGFIGKGLPGRPIYKHVIYAPGTWQGYAGITLPSIREAVAEQRWKEAKEQVREIANLLNKISST